MNQISIQDPNTSEQIMTVAKELIQSYGYNGFSYADIAERVGIRKATIHYHFPNKSYLAKITVARYRENFRQKFRHIEGQTNDPYHQIEMYVEMYRSVLEESDNICMCGMLAAEFATLPKDVSEEVQGFFLENEEWLANVIKLVRKLELGDIDRSDKSFEQDDAWLLLSGLEGAMLLARTHEGLPRFCSIVQRLLKGLGLVPTNIDSSTKNLLRKSVNGQGY
jgi:TetR/AcrR family transcriptional regulator, transcriptional repressor for nem operon